MPPAAAATPEARLAGIVAAYEALAPATLETLLALYADAARFVDPFQDVRGRDAVRAVFAHMFATLEDPRFVVGSALAGSDEALLLWRFTCRRRGHAALQVIEGATHLRFDAEGRIALHRDHWDAASQVWSQVPLLGRLLAALARRVAAPLPRR